MVRIIVFLFALFCAQHGVCGRTVPKQTSRLVNLYVKADDPERDAAGALLALSWWGQPVETAPTIKGIRIVYRDKNGSKRHAGSRITNGWTVYTPAPPAEKK